MKPIIGGGGQASYSEKWINIASNSTFGDKGVGGILWNTGIGLNKDSLTLKGDEAYLAYTLNATQNVALVNATWTVLSSFAGSSGSIDYKNGVVGVSYVDSNVKYIEDAGAGFSDPADLGVGSNPVALLGSRYVFFQAGTDIKLASSEALIAPKAITGFDFNALSPAVIGVIDEGAKTVALTVPAGTNVTALVPTITHTGASVSPASGVANNFTTPQTYTVTATDASTQAYVVTVTVAAPVDVVFDTSGSLGAGTYNNIAVNSPAVVTVSGDIAVIGCVTVNSGGTLLMGGFTFTGPGCFALNSGGTLGIGSAAGITSGAAGNIQTATRALDPGATYLYNGNASQFAGNALPSPVANLTIANTGALGNDKVTGNPGQAVTGLLKVQQGTYASASDYVDVQIDPAGTLSLAAAITVSGNWTNNGTFISNGFGVNFDGTAAQSIGGVSVTGFTDLTDSNTTAAVTFNSNFNVSGTFNMNGAGTVFTPGSPALQINSAGNTGTISGNGRVQVTRLSANPFSNQYRFFTFNVTALTVEWSGVGDQSIENGVAGYGGISVSGGGTKTIGGSGTLSISGDVAIAPGTTLAQGANTLNIGGNWNNGGGFNPGSAPVGVIFSGSGAQTITTGGSGTGKTFGILTIAKSGGTATLAGPLSCATLTVSSGTFNTSAANNYAVMVSGDLTLTPGGIFIANSSAVSVGGNWVNTGTFTAGGSTVIFNGVGGQTISGTTSFNNLTVSNTAGVTLNAPTTVSGTLALGTGGGGIIHTGVNVLTVGSAGSVTGAGSGSYVNGNLQKTVIIASFAGSQTWEVGDASRYAPINFTTGTGVTNIILTGSTTAGDHASIATSGLDASKTANRHWTLTTNSGLFSNANLTFNFDPADLDPTANTANFVVKKFDAPSTWASTTTGARTSTSTQATGVSGFSDFQVGELSPTPDLTIDNVTQAEGNAGPTTFAFTVSLSAPAPAGGVTFDIATADGTAQDDDPSVEDNDYVAKSLTAQTITAGNTSYTFDVTVNGDLGPEGDDNFFVNVTNVAGANVTDGQGLGTITNNDVCDPQTTVYVDDNWVGTPVGSDPDTGGPATQFGCDSFATIQGGVTGVTAGGQVIVYAGTYPESNNTINLTKSVRVTGPNAAISPNTGMRVAEAVVTSQGTSMTPNGVFRLDVSTFTVVIEGLKFDGTAAAINAYAPNNTISLKKNIFTASHDPGMYFETPNLTIDDNRFVGITSSLTEDVIAVGTNIGINRSPVSITNNVWINVAAGALNLDKVTGTISGNQFVNVQYYGIMLVRDSGNLNITDNLFNTITNPDPGNVPSWGAGVRFYEPAVTSPVNITGNTFKNSHAGVGIRGVPNDPGANITGQPINVHFNRFFSNNASISNGAAGTLAAENNWWGCNAGPNNAGCGPVTGNVAFTPWIVLRTTASPANILQGGTSDITADLRFNSANVNMASSGTIPNVFVAFTATEGNIAPTPVMTMLGVAQSLFTSTSALAGTACSELDNSGPICTPITVVSLIPEIQFSSPQYFEDESQTAIVTITRSGNLTDLSTVIFNTAPGGNANGGAACTGTADYVVQGSLLPRTITFGTNVATQTVLIDICGETIPEGTETLNLALSGGTNAALGMQTTAVLSINDTASQYLSVIPHQPIDMTFGGTASPYPSEITVSTGLMLIGSMRVTLYDVWHEHPDNIDVLLVGPQGQKYVLMADVGGPSVISQSGPVTLSFSDAATAALDNSAMLTTGEYRPTTCESPISNFPGPAPAGPYVEPGCNFVRPQAQTLLGTPPTGFGLTNPNGVWQLYVRDDAGFMPSLDQTQSIVGSIAGGWGLEFLAPTSADVSIGGRVLTREGRGIRGAIITVTGNALETPINVMTGVNGRYTIPGLTAGETYVVTVASRRFFFTEPSRVITLNDNVTDADFVAGQ